MFSYCKLIVCDLSVSQEYFGFRINPLRSNTDQRQISLCKSNAFSVREVMRIKDMTTQHEFRWYRHWTEL